MNGFYILTDVQNLCLAYGPGDHPSLGTLQLGQSIQNLLDQQPNLASQALGEQYRLYILPTLEGERGGKVTLSCAEINHKIRNPLTSMKLVADMLPVYLPEGSFKDKALEVLHNQIGKLETYTAELAARAGEGHE